MQCLKFASLRQICTCQEGYKWTNFTCRRHDCYKICKDSYECFDNSSSPANTHFSCESGVCVNIGPPNVLTGIILTFIALGISIGVIVVAINAWRSRRLHKPIIFGNFKLQSQLA